MTPRIVRLLPAAAALVVMTPALSAACTCVADIPLCESFWQADAVFAAEVVEIEERRPQKGIPSLAASRRVTFTVDHVWRGDVPSPVDVFTGTGRGDCGYRFRKGQKYLVYASEEQGRLITNICAPTKPLNRAAADLEYLKTPESAGGRIYGVVRIIGRRPAPKTIVVLRGADGQRQTMTNAAGEFAFAGMPAGAYTVRVVVPEGARAHGREDVMLRDRRACARRDFTIEAER